MRGSHYLECFKMQPNSPKLNVLTWTRDKNTQIKPKHILLVIAPKGRLWREPRAWFVGLTVKQSPTREAVAKSMWYTWWRGWLRSPCTGIASLPMTTLFFSSLRTQGWFGGLAVKQSPAREAVAKSMRYISWRGWLRSPCTSIASLAMTIRFFACHFNSKHFLEIGTTRQDDPFFSLSSQLQAFLRK